MGFNDREIVALSGAHTLGRAFKERSGTVKEGYGKKNSTTYTNADNNKPRYDGKHGLGMEGGRSWTVNWLTFDNSYFNVPKMNEEEKKHLLQLSTDKILHIDPIFKKYAEYYANNSNAFIEDYTKAHVKLSQLGSTFRPKQGFYL